MTPEQFIRNVVRLMAQYVASFPWVRSAQSSDWGRNWLRQITEGCPAEADPDALYARVYHPECAAAVLAACYVAPTLAAADTVMARVRWCAPLASPTVDVADGYHQVHCAVSRLGIDRLMYVPRYEMSAAICVVARRLLVISANATLETTLSCDVEARFRSLATELGVTYCSA